MEALAVALHVAAAHEALADAHRPQHRGADQAAHGGLAAAQQAAHLVDRHGPGRRHAAVGRHACSRARPRARCRRSRSAHRAGSARRLAGSASIAATSTPRAPRVLRMPIIPSSGRCPGPGGPVGVTAPPYQERRPRINAPADRACRSGSLLLDGARMTPRTLRPRRSRRSSLASGCDPVVNVYGSFFPAWVLCLLAGVGDRRRPAGRLRGDRSRGRIRARPARLPGARAPRRLRHLARCSSGGDVRRGRRTGARLRHPDRRRSSPAWWSRASRTASRAPTTPRCARTWSGIAPHVSGPLVDAERGRQPGRARGRSALRGRPASVRDRARAGARRAHAGAERGRRDHQGDRVGHRGGRPAGGGARLRPRPRRAARAAAAEAVRHPRPLRGGAREGAQPPTPPCERARRELDRQRQLLAQFGDVNARIAAAQAAVHGAELDLRVLLRRARRSTRA